MDYVSEALRRKVSEAARHRCGYCLTAQAITSGQMQIEHINPRSHGGTSQENNLWLSCAWCNSYKGEKINAIDPLTGVLAALYNPRTQVWSEHFRWSDDGVEIIGLTPIGRATVSALRLNNEFIVPARRRWVQAGWHPPVD